MKAVFGVLSLVVALAVVMLVARQQAHSVAVSGDGPGASGAAIAGEAKGIEEKARADVTRALQEGAQRTENADR